MTRIADYLDSTGVRTAAEEQYHRLAPMARDGMRKAGRSARQAAIAVAPYADSARDAAAHYADHARHTLAPKVSRAVRQAREALPPKVEHALDTAARRTRTTVRQATEYTMPRAQQVMATARGAAEPMAEEAVARGTAAVAALRGQVTAAEVERLVRRRARRARAGRFAKRIAITSLLAGSGYAAWMWWNRQTSPDWLAEGPDATEVGDRGGSSASSRTTFDSLDGTGPVMPNADAQARQAERSDRPSGKDGKSPS